jgi:integrase/recombinase XerD
MSALAPTLQAFFTDRLTRHTIASYRDTMRLLLTFAQRHARQAALQTGPRRLGRALVGARRRSSALGACRARRMSS